MQVYAVVKTYNQIVTLISTLQVVMKYNIISIVHGDKLVQLTKPATLSKKLLLKRNYIIPVYTAFELDGVGYDADEDELSHSWEQMDIGPAGHPNSPTNNAPIFRVFNPTESTKRTFQE